jgi:hypothetical protein
MESLDSLSLQDLVALEKSISAVCKKYENIALMNSQSTNEALVRDWKKATTALTHFNNKRNLVLDEMERRINDLV